MRLPWEINGKGLDFAGDLRYASFIMGIFANFFGRKDFDCE
jgi:hypothetical protein